MGIAFFFAAASNLRGKLKVDRVVPSARTYVHLHPGCISNIISNIRIKRRHFAEPRKLLCRRGNSLRIVRNRRLHCSTERQRPPRGAA